MKSLLKIISIVVIFWVVCYCAVYTIAGHSWGIRLWNMDKVFIDNCPDFYRI